MIEKVCFHTFCLFHNLIAYTYTVTRNAPEEPIEEEVLTLVKQPNRFFTTWNVIIQIVYFALALVIDLLQIFPNDFYKQHEGDLLYVRGYTYTAILFPATTLVCLMFWTLWHIDRELLLPCSVDKIIPNWHNQMLHTNIIFMVVAELFVEKQQLPEHLDALLGLNILGAVYGCV